MLRGETDRLGGRNKPAQNGHTERARRKQSAMPSSLILPTELLGWAALLVGYTLAMQAAGRSAGTIRLHRHYLAQLRERYPRRPLELTTAQLRELLANPEWAPETRKSCRSVLRGFYGWAHGEGYIDENPAERLATVRVPGGVPRPAPETLVHRLLGEVDPRRQLMVMLAAWCGLRAGEIARVHAHDYVAGELLVHGKGGKVRAVPVVDELLGERLEQLEGWAFPNGLGSHLTSGHVSRLLSAAMPEGWTAHTLRHRCGTVAYAGTRDLLAVSALLGHSRPETTQRYVKMPDDAVRAAALAARHPDRHPAA